MVKEPIKDPWDEPSTSSKRPSNNEPIPDEWDADDNEDEADNQKIWQDANAKAPMPQLRIAPSSTAPGGVTLPPAAFQAPIRILKRNPAGSSTSSASNSGSGTPNHQSFAEREARYQAARERIFASKDPDEQTRSSSEGTESRQSNVIRNPKGPGDEGKPGGNTSRGFRRLGEMPPVGSPDNNEPASMPAN
ncbi:hypothetical protein EWM64_g9190 [Hericium alpestre]|uniref:SUZ domain-containing protein n=1 Tax=Hericium alpestre TaxID=135208 RepID=A0A4Y9ZJD2_9AGAM|nr:hypothetical protein EWM64_g9190 [Hericium alpestre]